MSAEPKSIDFAEKSFKTVLEADIHQDNKAGRILSAMAFLSAAAASIFAKVYSASSSNSEIQQKLAQGLSPILNAADLHVINDLALSLQRPHATLFGIDWALMSFLIYIICILIGASFYLAALGPSFNIPSQLHHVEGHTTPKSLIFFRSIAEVSPAQWLEYWRSKNPVELQTEFENNYLFETHLIAEKTQTKVDFMSLGNVFFKLAFLFLAFLISSVFSYDLGLVRLIITVSTVLLTVTLFIDRYLHSPEGSILKKLLLLIPVWILIGAVLFFIKLA